MDVKEPEFIKEIYRIKEEISKEVDNDVHKLAGFIRKKEKHIEIKNNKQLAESLA